MNLYLLQKRRLELDYSRSDVAEKLGVPVSNFTHFEMGRRILTPRQTDKLCDIYRMKPAWVSKAPGVLRKKDIALYLKSLLLFDNDPFTVVHSGKDVFIKLKDEAFVTRWMRTKEKLMQNLISRDEYLSWIFQHDTSPNGIPGVNNLAIIRDREEDLDPGLVQRICDNLKMPFGSYLCFEDGSRVPNSTEKQQLTKAFSYPEETLFDNFSFETEEDVQMFFLTLEYLFGSDKVLAGTEGRIHINIPDVCYFLDKYAELETKYREGKILKSEYQMGWKHL